MAKCEYSKISVTPMQRRGDNHAECFKCGRLLQLAPGATVFPNHKKA